MLETNNAAYKEGKWLRIRKVYFNVFRDFRKYEKENFVFLVLFWLVFWLLFLFRYGIIVVEI